MNTLRDESERRRRLAMLGERHMAPLMRMVAAMRGREGPTRSIPAPDPCDGGAEARVVLLLEAPGPDAVASGFVSRDNPNLTARNLEELLRSSGIPRRETLIWNVVPWYLGDGKRIRAARAADLRAARPDLIDLFAILPRVRVVVLVGRPAQSVAGMVRHLTDATIVMSPHMSPQVFHINKAKVAEARATFAGLGTLLDQAGSA